MTDLLNDIIAHTRFQVTQTQRSMWQSKVIPIIMKENVAVGSNQSLQLMVVALKYRTSSKFTSLFTNATTQRQDVRPRNYANCMWVGRHTYMDTVVPLHFRGWLILNRRNMIEGLCRQPRHRWQIDTSQASRIARHIFAFEHRNCRIAKFVVLLVTLYCSCHA